jgi:hypothetical protein
MVARGSKRESWQTDRQALTIRYWLALSKVWYAFCCWQAHRIKRRIQDEQELGPPPSEPVRTSLAAIGGRPTGSRAAQPQQGTTLGGVFGAPSAGHDPLFGGPPLPPAQVAPQRAARPLAVVADDEFMGLGLGSSENGPLPGYSTMPQVRRAFAALGPCHGREAGTSACECHLSRMLSLLTRQCLCVLCR